MTEKGKLVRAIAVSLQSSRGALFGQIQAGFSGNNISITGVTKNGSVAVYGVGQSVRDGREIVTTHQSIARSSATGSAFDSACRALLSGREEILVLLSLQ